MLRPSICFVAVCIFLVTGKTQAQELSNTVVYLREGNNYGTGFFVRAKDYYLVTAEHVANYLRPFSTAVVRGENGSAIKFNLADLTGTSSASLDWKTHSNSDVAVLRIQSQGDAWQKIQARFVSIDWLAPQLGTPIRERPVTVMGFPLQLGTEGNFSRITAEAKTASGLLRLLSPAIKREAIFYVLDKPSIGSFSGGPAILLSTPYFKDGSQIIPGPDNPPLFVGLVHGLVADKNGNGLALIVPSKFIADVILKADDAKKG